MFYRLNPIKNRRTCTQFHWRIRNSQAQYISDSIPDQALDDGPVLVYEIDCEVSMQYSIIIDAVGTLRYP
ncbi:hypothetical protein MVEG_04185 [Podila verticillata NRRL 6337]|nr:hypothetical protein MVEG_04185 [Podila verticillata NRRL 6337]